MRQAACWRRICPCFRHLQILVVLRVDPRLCSSINLRRIAIVRQAGYSSAWRSSRAVSGPRYRDLTPGQGTLCILRRSVAQGRRAGILSALDIASGTLIHFRRFWRPPRRRLRRLKLGGGVPGLSAYAFPSRRGSCLGASSATPWQTYRAGLLTNLLNPKVALFFLAFLPQFVAPSADSRALAFLFLGAVFVTTGTIRRLSVGVVWLDDQPSPPLSIIHTIGSRTGRRRDVRRLRR